MSSLLITRPRHDTTTHYLYCWAEKLLEEARRKRLAFDDLERKKAIRKNVEKCLKAKSVSIAIFNGHGDAKNMQGQDFEPLITVGVNEGLLSGAAVYMRACDAGKILGRKIVDAGGKGFIGYSEEFAFPCMDTSKPITDELAAPCLDSSNEIGLALIRGRSAREAHERGLKAQQKKIDEILYSSAPNAYIAWFLNWNMENQVCIEP